MKRMQRNFRKYGEECLGSAASPFSISRKWRVCVYSQWSQSENSKRKRKCVDSREIRSCGLKFRCARALEESSENEMMRVRWYAEVKKRRTFHAVYAHPYFWRFLARQRAAPSAPTCSASSKFWKPSIFHWSNLKMRAGTFYNKGRQLWEKSLALSALARLVCGKASLDQIYGQSRLCAGRLLRQVRRSPGSATTRSSARLFCLCAQQHQRNVAQQPQWKIRAVPEPCAM